MTNTKVLANKIAAAAAGKKATDILLLNMEGISPVTDYFMICSARKPSMAMPRQKVLPKPLLNLPRKRA